MRVGVVRRGLPISGDIYLKNVGRELGLLGCDLLELDGEPDDLGWTDVLWDPGLFAGNYPRWVPPVAFDSRGWPPIVVTLHGAGRFALSKLGCDSGQRGLSIRIKLLRKRLGWLLRRSRVAHIITPSEYERSNILHYLPPGSNPTVTAIHHGVDHTLFSPSNGSRAERDGGYLLHVSRYKPKKNLRRMLAAYDLLPPDSRPQFRIVCPGAPPIPLPKGAQMTKKVEQDRLVQLYRSSLAFIFPSLHESFGMPILEAMAVGTPVLTSNGSACREVAGAAGLLADPCDVEDIASKMQSLVEDDGLRSRLAAEGLRQSQKFTWEGCGRRIVDVFSRVVRT